MYGLSIPPRKRYTGNDGKSREVGTTLKKGWSVSVGDSDAATISCENCEWREVNVVSDVLRKHGGRVGFKVMFLTIPRQGTTPQILKLKFPVHTSCQKQKRK